MDKVRKKPGRKPRYSDDYLVALIASGHHTADALLETLGMRSKSALMIRLRRLRDQGRIEIVERKRCEGFSLYVK